MMEDMQTVKENIKEDAPKKCHLRLKKLCSQIRDQMEFYFSDASLHKDRFLKKLISESPDGYVNLSVFAKFNKLRSLTEDMSLVAKALSTSELLQVSEDKQKVKRRKPMTDQKDVDDRTVYVECLPLKADHDWVKKIFQSCGKVVYVSLPKYRTTGDFKGFGFVEFETVEGAKKACEVLNKPPSSAGDRVGKFPRANKQIRQLEKQLKTQDGDTRDPRLARRGRRQRTMSEGTISEDGGEKPSWRKRRHTISESTDTQDVAQHHNGKEINPSSPKRIKLDLSNQSKGHDHSDGGNHHDPEGDQTVESRKRKTSETNSEVSSATDGEDQSDGVSASKKVRISEDIEVKSPEQKKTKRKRKRNKKKEVTKHESPELRVIPKREWLQLKNEYLQLQKACMNQLKRTLRDDRVNTDSSETQEPNGPHKTEGCGTDKQAQRCRQIEFLPGVIIKVSRNGEALTRKEVKEHASSVASVAYVDVKDGNVEGYIRCQSAEDASTLSKASDECYSYSLVEGDAEKEYWNKIQKDRDQKLNSKSKPHAIRGRDKKLKKAEKILTEHQRKHIIFDDGDD